MKYQTIHIEGAILSADILDKIVRNSIRGRSPRTPEEVYNNSPPVKMIEFEKGSDIPEMELELSFLESRRHLPIIEFKKAA